MTANVKPRAGEHTKGPWINDDTLILPSGFDDADDSRYQAWIADLRAASNAEANARRIVACVNACDGFSTTELENRSLMDQLRAREKELVRERDLAIAHDTQPYPTAAAYEALAKAHNALRAHNAALVEALKDCAAAISDELGACGDDEIKEHPMFASHAKTLKRARAALSKVRP